MCGIIAYIGKQQAADILLTGLKRMEYRGYDSAGIALARGGAAAEDGKEAEAAGSLNIIKRAGKVKNLEDALGADTRDSVVGMGHTRWATHGPPTDVNAHPHSNVSGTIAVVHNGIVENFSPLRAELLRKGYKLKSQTDTELVAHLIEDVLSSSPELTLLEAVRLAATQLEGAFGLVVMSSRHPGVLVGARRGSPLVIGVGDDELMLASDASAFIDRTREVIFLNDDELVELQFDGVYKVVDIGSVVKPKEVQLLEMELTEIEKGGYEHFMLKEIMEQPKSLEDCMRGRVAMDGSSMRLGGLEGVMDKLVAARRFVIVACGTSWHSGLVGEYLIEGLARVPVEVEYASEFRYRKPILFPDDVLIAISQSGETADTLAAIMEAKSQGVLTIGVCNVVGSTIARETEAGVYLHCGPEIGVASTKAFTSQICVLTLIAIQLAASRGELSDERKVELLRCMQELPSKVSTALEQADSILQLCKVFRYAHNFLYLGRGLNFPVALEGALKLKEISYIHAEGYPAAEMKHGPIALIDSFMPVVFISMSSDPVYDKIKSNIEEVLARGGCVIVVTEEGNTDFDDKVEFVIRVPDVDEILAPLVSVIPLQLMSYYIACMRGCNVDQPRNLAKSVTVE